MTVLTNNAAEKLWEEKTAEMNEYLQMVCPAIAGYPGPFPENLPVEKIANANFELDWIPAGLKLINLRDKTDMYYEAVLLNEPDNSRQDPLDAFSGFGGAALASKDRRRGEPRGGSHFVKFYWWGEQQFAQESVGGYWVLWHPDVCCLNQPAHIQKGPCEVFAKKIFNLAENSGKFPHIAELAYLLLLHKWRAPNYVKDGNFIGNFIRSGTPFAPACGSNTSMYQNDLLLAAGWKLERVSETSDLKLLLHLDAFPFYGAFKNLGVVPFVAVR
ncbi:MAG: hypothetical protein AAB851_03405 [Patescibacteria group bacterium]